MQTSRKGRGCFPKECNDDGEGRFEQRETQRNRGGAGRNAGDRMMRWSPINFLCSMAYSKETGAVKFTVASGKGMIISGAPMGVREAIKERQSGMLGRR